MCVCVCVCVCVCERESVGGCAWGEQEGVRVCVCLTACSIDQKINQQPFCSIVAHNGYGSIKTKQNTHTHTHTLTQSSAQSQNDISAFFV